jgi:hypothetical protein
MEQTKQSFQQKFSSFWHDYPWIMVGILWIVAFTLSYLGFERELISEGLDHTPLDLIYLSIQLFTLNEGAFLGEKNLQIEIARFLAPSVAAYTLFQTIAVVFKDQFQALRLRSLKNHVIVCGLGKKGTLYANGFSKQGFDVVGIDKDPNNPEIEGLKNKGVITLPDKADTITTLEKAGVGDAKYLITTCGNDGVNVDIGIMAGELTRHRTQNDLNAFLHVVDPEFRTLLREQEFKMGDEQGIRYEFFNIFDKGAQSLVNEYPLFISGEEDSDHFVIIGFDDLGQQLLIHTARLWFRNRGNKSTKLCVSIFDENADSVLENLLYLHPHIDDVCDIQTQVIDTTSDHFIGNTLRLVKRTPEKKSKVYICLDDDSLSLKIGYRIHAFMHDEVSMIIIQTDHQKGLAELLRRRQADGGGNGHIYPFGLYDKTCTPDLLVFGTHEMISRAIHTGYLDFYDQDDQSSQTVYSWESLSKEDKESCRKQADHIMDKLNNINCDLGLLTSWDEPPYSFNDEQIEIMAMLEHDRWLREKKLSGWKWGEIKDKKRKRNPNLVPWGELSQEVQELNREMVRKMPELLSRVGLRIFHN